VIFASIASATNFMLLYQNLSIITWIAKRFVETIIED